MHLLCAPSVGPGYDARRGSGDPRVKPRRNGATYDAMWRAAIAAKADRVTITSFNEWHEGTQIEPAAPRGPARALPLPLVQRRVGPARRRRRERVSRADALLGGRLPQHVAGAAEDQRLVDAVVLDAAQLRVVEVDDRVGPRLEPERGGALVRADRRAGRRAG